MPPGTTSDGRGVWQRSLRHRAALRHARTTLHLEDAKALVANGVQGRGARARTCPPRIEATEYFQENGVVFMPGKAANAGGVAYLRPGDVARTPSVSPGPSRRSTPSSSSIMREHLPQRADDAAKEYGHEGNFVMGANIAGFEKVADAMMAQGVC